MCIGCPGRMHVSRRHVLIGSVAAFSAGLLSRPILAETVVAPPPNAISPDEALQRIMEGNARYAANTMLSRDYSAGRAARAKVQFPIAAILSCADSRVSPELAFDQGPGELFVVRLAGNFVNEDALASMEYGARFLGVPLVMVLGHSNCGAVSSAIKVLNDGTVLPGHLPALIASIRPPVEAARQKSPVNLLEEATAENVRYNVKRLSSADPIMSELVRDGKVKVAGGVYDIESGKVSLL